MLTCIEQGNTCGRVILNDLAGEAIRAALAAAGIELSAIQAAYLGNAAAGTITGQVCIPGEVVLRSMGLAAFR
jgi:hypothetical protein